MRIGNRSDPNYYRVYQKTKKLNYGVYDEMNCGLEFEFELKNQLIKSLQKIEPVLENFSDGGFQSYVAFPYLKVERKKGWCIELSICQELCSYRYPFHLPVNFLNYQDNFELKVKFVLL